MRLGDYVSVKTGKLDANAADENGEYPFFTCSVNSLRINRYDYDCECVLVAGNGDLNVKYYDGKFNAYQRTYIIESNDKNVLLVPYLYRFMEKYVERLRSDAIGGVIKYIKLSNITDADIHICTLDEQREKVNILDRVDALICKYQLKQALMEDIVKSRFVEMFGDPVTNPMGWAEHTLDEYIEFLTSGSRGWSKYFSDNGEIFITIKNVKNNRITLENVQYVTPPDNAEAKRTKVREGDLLISITADLGRTGVVSKELEERGAYINQHLTCIRLKKEEINPGYVSYFMESDAGKRQFDTKNQSAVKAGLNFDAIKSLKVLVPPRELQNEYISFVELTDKSKLAIQQSIETLQTLKAKLMQDYFG
ncbi:restriction endonuclease subunit S [Selenomonas ruminantium]|uniref:Type I restriction enzyme, S subunit n=1 Tax=Selenomonas ruminantium TaxID=971 RepID=A0A1H0T2P8_SELRU|nr:restriction endonuclease subunit S [Selenomonas ruminantium]SDP48095.1 type I restriction enzyme, S subunit [Selenomonas ruminantium]